MTCQYGSWKELGGIGQGEVVSLGEFSGSHSFKNPSPLPILVQATGGGNRRCGGDGPNSNDLRGYSNGTLLQGVHRVFNGWSFTNSISFMAPGRATVLIASTPYQCGHGQFRLHYTRLD